MNDLFTQITETHYLEALGIALGVYLLLAFLKSFLVATLRRVFIKTKSRVDDLLLDTFSCTRQFFMLALAIYLGSHVLLFGKKFHSAINSVMLVIFAIQFIIWGKAFINGWLNLTLERRNNDPAVKMSLNFMGILIKTAFISLVVLFVLNNMGVDVTTFVTGLGIGGVAIALATQKILGDLFSSLSIVMDKPFVVGDAINVSPDISGTIEHVGLKTTRIKSISGEQIVISNSDLLASRIRNYKRMTERRVAFQLGLTYKSKRESLEKIPEIIQGIVVQEAKTRFERAHFIRFGASSLDFEVIYWITDPDYMLYADIHQRVLYAIHEAFENEQLELAFPTQTLIVQN